MMGIEEYKAILSGMLVKAVELFLVEISTSKDEDIPHYLSRGP
jgi:hypothetical protein